MNNEQRMRRRLISALNDATKIAEQIRDEAKRQGNLTGEWFCRASNAAIAIDRQGDTHYADELREDAERYRRQSQDESVSVVVFGRVIEDIQSIANTVQLGMLPTGFENLTTKEGEE